MSEQLRKDVMHCFWLEFRYHGITEKDLTDHEIQALSSTLKFSIWMMRTKYSECIISIKSIIKQIIKK